MIQNRTELNMQGYFCFEGLAHKLVPFIYFQSCSFLGGMGIVNWIAEKQEENKEDKFIDFCPGSTSLAFCCIYSGAYWERHWCDVNPIWIWSAGHVNDRTHHHTAQTGPVYVQCVCLCVLRAPQWHKRLCVGLYVGETRECVYMWVRWVYVTAVFARGRCCACG